MLWVSPLLLTILRLRVVLVLNVAMFRLQPLYSLLYFFEFRRLNSKLHYFGCRMCSLDSVGLSLSNLVLFLKQEVLSVVLLLVQPVLTALLFWVRSVLKVVHALYSKLYCCGMQG